MSVLVIAALRFKDESRYERYQAAFAQIFAKWGGSLLAASRPTMLEGHELFDKAVVMRFSDAERAMMFLESAEYECISGDRRAGAETIAWLVSEITASSP